MSCCKNKNVDSLIENTASSSNINIILKYFLKIFGFLVILISLPIINLVIIWFIFNILVLNKKTDVKPILTSLGKKFKNDDGDDFIDKNITMGDVIIKD